MQGQRVNKPRRSRSSLALCPAVKQAVLTEQQERILRGLHNTSENDIVNDWLWQHTQCLMWARANRGYRGYPGHPFQNASLKLIPSSVDGFMQLDGVIDIPDNADTEPKD